MSVNDFLAAATSTEQLLYGVGALGALGRTDELRQLCDAYLADEHDPMALYETVLQLYLFAGYPRAINALIELHDAWQAAGLDPLPGYPPPTGEALAEWRERGTALCKEVYGRNYKPMRERMHHLSPELSVWMVDEGYGKVLSRPALDPAARECSVVGALTALGVERQLISHLKGSLNLGIQAARIGDALDLLAHLLPKAEVAAARAHLDRLVAKQR